MTPTRIIKRAQSSEGRGQRAKGRAQSAKGALYTSEGRSPSLETQISKR
jgi:hypothetical protein